jgi:DNA-binding CsgD family transcriptional regulator
MIELGCLSPRMSPTGDTQALAQRISRLSEREREVLEMAASGLSDAEIATSLWITQETVRVHLRHIVGSLVEGKTKARPM